MSTRPLPNNPEAERTVLGASMLTPEAFESAASLAVADFYSGPNRRVFEAMGLLAAAGRSIDLVTVKDQLARMQALKEVTPEYLASLVDGVPRMTNVEQWAQIVKDKARLRAIAAQAERIYRGAVDGTHGPGELVDESVTALLAEADRGTGWCDNRELVRGAIREIEEQAATRDGVLGLRTGLVDLDERLQGIRAGTFGVIGARLGQGKSTLALQVAEQVAYDSDGRVAFFSLEMGGVALMKRRLASMARVSINRLYRVAEDADAREKRWSRIARASADCTRPDLMLNTACRSVAQIRAASREVQVKHGLALVVVDYLQLISTTRKRERRSLEIADVSGDLLQMAHALNVPVIAVSQLNRESEARPDHRPTMADLADGDSIGRDCDWCVLIQRDLKPPKGESAERYRNMAYLWLAKHREGASGKVEVRFNSVLAQFQNLATDEQQGAA